MAYTAWKETRTNLNTADLYANGLNQRLPREALPSRRRKKGVMSVKVGVLAGMKGGPYGQDICPVAIRNYSNSMLK